MQPLALTPDQFQSLLDQAVELATAAVRRELAETQAGLEAVKRNRDAILAEKKSLEGKKPVPDEVLKRVMDNADAVLRSGGIGRPIQSAASSYELTREDARDPAKWRMAKEAAERAGKPGPVIVAPEVPGPSPTGSVARVVRTDQAIYARHDAYRDPREYRRLREEAARDHKDLRSFNDRATLAAASEGDADALTYFDRIARGDGSKIVRENER